MVADQQLNSKRKTNRNGQTDTFSLIARLRRCRSTQKYTTKPRYILSCGALSGGFADTFLFVVRQHKATFYENETLDLHTIIDNSFLQQSAAKNWHL